MPSASTTTALPDDAKVWEHAFTHIRADGPVDRASIEYWLVRQTQGVTWDNVHLVSVRFLNAALERRAIYVFDGCGDETSYCARAEKASTIKPCHS